MADDFEPSKGDSPSSDSLASGGHPSLSEAQPRSRKRHREPDSQDAQLSASDPAQHPACHTEEETNLGRRSDIRGGKRPSKQQPVLVDREVQATEGTDELESPARAVLSENLEGLAAKAKAVLIRDPYASRDEPCQGDAGNAKEWARLISPFSQNPSCIPLCGAKFLIGSSSKCDWQIPPGGPSSSYLCRLSMDPENVEEVNGIIESMTEKGAVSVNGHILKKGDKAALRGGYEINLGAIPPHPSGAGSFAFIFVPSLRSLKQGSAAAEQQQQKPQQDADGAKQSLEGEAKEAGAQQEQHGGEEEGEEDDAAAAVSFEEGPPKGSEAPEAKDCSPFASSPPLGTAAAAKGKAAAAQGDAELLPPAPAEALPPRRAAAQDSDTEMQEEEEGAATDKQGASLSRTTSKSTRTGDRHKRPRTSLSLPVKRTPEEKAALLASTAASKPDLEHFKSEFRKGLLKAGSLTTTFANLPYHISNGGKQTLMHTAFLNLCSSGTVRGALQQAMELPSMNPRVLLAGPQGSELYLEAVTNALASHYGASLLVYDRVALGLDARRAAKAESSAAGGDRSAPASSSGAHQRMKGLDVADDCVDDLLPAKDGDDTPYELPSLERYRAPSASDRSSGELVLLRPPTMMLKPSEASDVSAEDPTSAVKKPSKHASVMDKVAAFSSRGGSARAAAAAAAAPGGGPQRMPSSVARKLEKSRRPLTKDDRVRFIGASSGGSGAGGRGGMGPLLGLGQGGPSLLWPPSRGNSGGASKESPLRGPFFNCPGRVVMVFETKPSKVGVRFDYPLPGGTSLGGICEENHGYWCSVRDLRLEGSGTAEEAESAAIEALFDVAEDASAKEPVVILLKDVDKAVMGNVERFLHFKRRAEKLPANAMLVGLHAGVDGRRDRPYAGLFARIGGLGGGGGGGGMSSNQGPNPGALLDLSFLDSLRPGADSDRSSMQVPRIDQPKLSKMLQRLLPNRIVLHPPQGAQEAAEWKKCIERDVETMRERANRQALATVSKRCNIEIPGDELESVVIKDEPLAPDNAEKVLGWAVTHQLMEAEKLKKEKGTATAEADQQEKEEEKEEEEKEEKGEGAAAAAEEALRDGRFVLKASSIQSGMELLRESASEATSLAAADAKSSVLRSVQTDNEFEKRLLSEVIPADEVGVSFDDIGALDTVKTTLREVVMLPLQRPELFTRGSLTKPTRGVLLFGPPGTGKTMLAKAVASESGANFINVSMATLASKWFGEGEKYVRALFSLAHKIAPSVVFVDEVDSMLGRRDKTGEHEAMRKIKNEFMSNWDGLRTKESDRVLVLAATNRPYDLDEAVIRRMPRRLMIDLPDAVNRVKILRVILKDEELEADFDFESLASMTEGYSGSDLRNLCVAAAYRPIRDFLEDERKAKSASESSKAGAAVGGTKEPLPTPSDSVPGTKATTESHHDPSTSKQDDQDQAVPQQSVTVDKAAPKPEAPPPAAAKATAAAATGAAESSSSGKAVKLRALTLEDLIGAQEEVSASVSGDASSMGELQRWNEMYGEGGNRRSSTLTYFM